MLAVPRRHAAALATTLIVALAGCGAGAAVDDADAQTIDAGRPDAPRADGGGPDGPPADAGGLDATAPAPFQWDLPSYYPRPPVPTTNPLTAAGVELGRRLFYDVRLSVNLTTSCASCHDQAKAFTDGRAKARGATGQAHPRSAQGLANVAWFTRFGWGNPSLTTIEQTLRVPLFGTTPVELGMGGREQELLDRLAGVPLYQELFAAAYPGDPAPVTVDNVIKALASFVRTMVSARAPFDRFYFGQEAAAISEPARRGYTFFLLHCSGFCHTGDAVVFSDNVAAPFGNEQGFFHVNATYNLDGDGLYPPGQQGAFEITGDPNDMGRFRTASLKNIAVTAPYFHDGSAATLDDVIDHYAAGGRTITFGAILSVGSANPRREIFGFPITAQERADLHAFFDSLTDTAFLTDPQFADPW